MPQVESSATPEEINNDNKVRSEEVNKFADALKDSDIIKDLDLPAAPVKRQEVKELEQEQEEPQEEQEQEDQEPQQEQEQGSESQEQEDDNEELVPKSKIQPRIDKIKSEANYWKNRYESEVKAVKPEPKDELSEKLENMSESELKNLKREARIAQLEAKDDKAKLSQLLDLEEKVDDAIRTQPQKFSARQTAYFQNVANEIAATEGFSEKDAPAILKIAQEIYSSEPDLQKDVKGQGLALKAAVREYKAISRSNLKTQDNTKLKTQLNTLKRATSLETKGVRQVSGSQNVVAGLLRKSKISGLTNSEKVSLITNDDRFGIDALIPSDYK
jgi:hypothetical protein